MNNRIFDLLRTLGWLVPMLAVFYAVLADACSLPGAPAVEKIAAGFAVLVNGIVEKARANHAKSADFYVGFEDESGGDVE